MAPSANDDDRTRGLALYYYASCGFCEDVRRTLDDLGVELEMRNIVHEPRYREELVEARGRPTVPVLRIEQDDGSVQWLPESRDIIDYLYERFGEGRRPGAATRRLTRWLMVAMWTLLLGGLVVDGGVRAALWTAACAVASSRSGLLAWKTRAWPHTLIAATFAAAAVLIALEGLGIASVAWWYGAYAVAGFLLLASVVGWLNTRKRG